MTLRKNSPRAKRRWIGLGVATTAMMLLIAGAALAVHDLEFQLDGDVLASTETNVGNDATPETVDWDTLFDAAGAENALPTNFTASGFDRDFRANPGCTLTATGTFCTADTTTFATGSKDTLPITPGWQCNFDNNVNSKIDIMNAYAAEYVDPDTGHEILYFALERNTNTGDANVAFWFLQEDVNCASASGSTAFTGDHQDGDLLAVSAFTKGGGVSVIDVYRWNGGANGSLGTTSVAHGVDCKATAGGDTACATTNSGPLEENDPISTPWLTANKADGVGHTLQVAEFFEGGVDLTEADLGGHCFNVFIGDTRSSQSLTATLFDYARGKLGECGSTTVTTPSISSEEIPVTGQLSVTDSALVTVTGADTFSGDVTFYLCEASELVDENGDPDPADGTCATGGTLIGSAKAVTTSPATVVSDAAGLTAAGHYCWRADFSGDEDAGVPGSSDSATTECFDVTPVTPTLTTSASADITLGDVIYDTISLTGTAETPGTDGDGPDGSINATDRSPAGGTISFTAYGPDDCSTVAHSGSLDVSGDNTAYGGSGSATEFTPLAPGQYTYVASYDGDTPNTNGAGPSACPDLTDTEEVTVTGEAAVSTAQDWLPNDTATITGPTALSGTVTFTLFTGLDCGAGDDDDIVYGPVEVGVSGASPQTAETSNTTLVLEAGSGDYSWLVSYDDDVLGDPADTCETTTIDITD
jgi:hypothetical protein